MANEIQLKTDIYNGIVLNNPNISNDDALKQTDDIMSKMLSGQLSYEEIEQTGLNPEILENEEYKDVIEILQNPNYVTYTNQENNFASTLDSNTTSALISVLENVVNEQEKALKATKENNGIIAKGWDWFKNKTGIGQGSDKTQKEIDELKNKIEKLKNGKESLDDVYKSVTGNDLDYDELNALIEGSADFSNSKVINSVSKYQQGQKQVTNTISTIASGLTIVGLTAAGIVATPFTGGLSLGASLAAIGTLTAAGTAAYMVPQVMDGTTEKDGYSFKEAAQDVATGTINSALTATGIGAGKAINGTLTAAATTQGGKTAARLAANEATSLIIGDGMAVSNYAIEAGFNENVDFSLATLGQVTASATAGSIMAGATSFATTAYLNPALTSGTSAQSQIFGRLLSSGITGSATGATATMAASGTNYLISCQVKGEEVTFEDWLDATTSNAASGAITGFIMGTSFEAVQMAAGAPLPNMAVKSQNNTTENGLKYRQYFDKDGNLIAMDVNSKDFANALKAGQLPQNGVVEYNPNTTTSNTSRIIRFTFDTKSSIINQNGTSYKADAALIRGYQYNWANNSTFLGQKGYLNLTQMPTDTYYNLNSTNNELICQNNNYSIVTQAQNPISPQTLELNNTISANAAIINNINNPLINLDNSRTYKYPQLYQNASVLHQTYEANINQAFTDVNNRFGDLESVTKITARAKGTDSIYEKLEKKYDKNNLNSTNINDSYAVIGDAFGTRMQIKSLNQNDVVEVLKQQNINCSYDEICQYFEGNYDNLNQDLIDVLDESKTQILDSLKTMQTNSVVDRIVQEIQNSENPLEITEINNYGNEISSYFTDEQINKIADAYFERTGKKLSIITMRGSFEGELKMDDEGKPYIDTETCNIITNGAQKPSGYVSTHLNVEHNLGNDAVGLGELQIRGTSVNTFAQVEHIPYDIRQDKIKADDIRYQDIYKTLKSLSDESYEKYNQYLTDVYDYLRLSELGINIKEPQIGQGYVDKYGNTIDVSNLTKEALMKYAH